MHWQQQVSEKHHCDKSYCRTPSNLTGDRFCIHCSQTVSPYPISELKREFVPITKKELRERERLPMRFQPELCYGEPPDKTHRRPQNYWQTSPSFGQGYRDSRQQYPNYNYGNCWENSLPLENSSGKVLGYYRFVLVQQPGDSGKGGKLFWLMVIGAAVWFWFFR
ncbi:MAG: hypothetical protein HC786_11085 [Richelia sp. CSU_2_1]|nr:hypothetical protein [Richelia sp. CSU_2_1]